MWYIHKYIIKMQECANELVCFVFINVHMNIFIKKLITKLSTLLLLCSPIFAIARGLYILKTINTLAEFALTSCSLRSTLLAILVLMLFAMYIELSPATEPKHNDSKLIGISWILHAKRIYMRFLTCYWVQMPIVAISSRVRLNILKWAYW